MWAWNNYLMFLFLLCSILPIQFSPFLVCESITIYSLKNAVDPVTFTTQKGFSKNILLFPRHKLAIVKYYSKDEIFINIKGFNKILFLNFICPFWNLKVSIIKILQDSLRCCSQNFENHICKYQQASALYLLESFENISESSFGWKFFF